MATVSRYYPTGYIGSEQAVVLLAKLRSPENWQLELMAAEELEIWNGLGYKFNAEALHYLLFCLTKISRIHPSIDVHQIGARFAVSTMPCKICDVHCMPEI